MFYTASKLWVLYRSPLWKAARKAVKQVMADTPIQNAAKSESKLSYCPRCGQIPTDDRRMEEARELTLKQIDYVPRRHDMDFVLNWHYFRIKV